MKRRGFLRTALAGASALACKALPKGHEPKAIEGEVVEPPATAELWDILALGGGMQFAYKVLRSRWRVDF